MQISYTTGFLLLLGGGLLAAALLRQRDRSNRRSRRQPPAEPPALVGVTVPSSKGPPALTAKRFLVEGGESYHAPVSIN